MKQKLIAQSIAVLLGLLAINWVVNRFAMQWDLTQEKRYSLTSDSKQLLGSLEEPMEVYVFLENDKLPAAFKRLQQETRELLRQFERESGGKLSFTFENPVKNLTGEERQKTMLELQQRGITATNVRVKSKDGYSENVIFPGALINYGERQFPVQLLSGQGGQGDLNQSIELLEYRFANAIAKLKKDKVATVAFTAGHDELNASQLMDLRQSLGQNFIQSKSIDLAAQNLSPEEVDVLVVAKPKTEFSEQEKFKIDQFLMNGGRAIFAIDPMKMELDSLKTQWGGRNVAVDYKLNLDDMLFKYGVRLNRNLVRDLQSKPIPIIVDDNGQSQLFPWTFYPVITAEGGHITTENIPPVSLEFVSSIDTLKVPGLKKSVLLRSSENAGLVANPVLVDLEELRNPPPNSAFTQQNLPVAVLLEGEFTSIFQHRAAPMEVQLSRKDKSIPTAIAVIADGDVMQNTVLPNGENLPLGYDRNIGEQFGNKEFMLNLIDYLINPEHPLQARNKQYKIRLLNQTKAEEQKSKWQSLAVGLPLLLIGLFGMIFILWRKRKWGK